MTRRLSLCVVMLSAVLTACSQEPPASAQVDVDLGTASFAGLAPASRNFVLADAEADLGLSGAFLYVDADEENTTANNWRFRLAVTSTDLPIEQVYLDVRNAGDEESYGVFQLCDTETGCNTNSMQGWVSGLNPRTLGLEEGADFTLRLVAENTEQQAHIVATQPLTWAPLSLSAPALSLSDTTLTAEWEGISQTEPDQLLRYNLFVVDGLYATRSAAIAAETNRWQRRAIEGTSTNLTVDAVDLTAWVTAVNASGEVAFSPVVQLDVTPPPAPSISLNSDTGSVAGVTSNGAFTVTGLEDGATLEYSTDGGDTWSTTVPTAVEGINSIRVRQTDNAGNVSASNELQFTLDTIPPSATVTINPVTADNIINANESASNIAITGVLSGEASEGDEVRVIVNGNTFTGTVDSSQEFSVTVTGSILAGSTSLSVQADITDGAGNTNTVSATRNYNIDTIAPTVTFDAETFYGGGIAQGDIVVNPVISGMASEANTTVTVTVNGQDYPANVSVMNWSVEMTEPLSNGNFAISVSATDVAGNVGAGATADLSINNADPVLTFDDMIISAATTYPFDFPVSLDLAEDEVALLNVIVFPGSGENMRVFSTATPMGSGLWYVPIDLTTLSLSDDIYSGQVEVYVENVWDTEFAAYSDLVVKTTPPNASTVNIAVDNITADNIINYSESLDQFLTLSGTITGDVTIGDNITVSVGMNEPKTTTLNGDFTFSIDVEATELVANTEVTVVISANDGINPPVNIAQNHAYTVDTDAPIITLETTTANTLSPLISGTSNEFADLTLTLNEVEGSGVFTLPTQTVSSAWTFDLSMLGVTLTPGDWEISASAIDDAGNGSNLIEPAVLTITLPPVVSDDNYIRIWDGVSVVSISPTNGVLSNDSDPNGLPLTVSSMSLLQGSGSLTYFTDGAFDYSPSSTDQVVTLEYIASNGIEASSTAQVTLTLRREDASELQACLFLPAQIAAGEDLTWDLDPFNSLDSGSSLSVLSSPSPSGLNFAISGTQATFTSPQAGLYSGLTLEATNAYGETDVLGPYSINVEDPYTSSAHTALNTNQMSISHTAADAQGRLMVMGGATNFADETITELRLVRLDRNGNLDATFGTNGVVTHVLPASTRSGVTVQTATANVQTSLRLGDEWLIGGYIHYTADAGATEWTAAFLLRTSADGSLSPLFVDGQNNPGIWVREGATENYEVGALLLQGTEDLYVAVNTLLFDTGRVRPSSSTVYITTPLDWPNSEFSVLFGETDYRIRVMATVPDSRDVMVAAQFYSGSENDYLHFARYINNASSWSGDLSLNSDFNYLAALDSAGDTTTNFPDIRHAVVTEAGQLWISGQKDTQSSTNTTYYVAVIDLDYNYVDPGVFEVDAPGFNNQQYSLGLIAGYDNAVYHLRSDVTSTSMQRYLTNGSIDTTYGITGSKSVTGLVADVTSLSRAKGSAIIQGTQLLIVQPDAADLTQYRSQQIDVYEPNEHAFFATVDVCGVVARTSEEVSGSPIPRGMVASGTDLYVAFEAAGWNIGKLINGTQWVLGDERGGYYTDAPNFNYNELMGLSVDNLGRTVTVGFAYASNVVRRFNTDGTPDTTFLPEALSFSPQFVAVDSLDRVIVAGIDPYSQTPIINLLRFNSDGSLDDTFNTTFAANDPDIPISGLELSDLAVDANDNLLLLFFASDLSSETHLARVNADGTLDAAFGNEVGAEDNDARWSSTAIGTGYSLLVADSGRLYIWAYEEDLQIAFGNVHVQALTTSGQPDSSFGSNGVVTLNGYESPLDSFYLFNSRTKFHWLTEDLEGRLYVAAREFNAGRTVVFRLEANGDYSSNWGNEGIVPMTGAAQFSDTLHSLALVNDQLRVLWSDLESSGVLTLDANGMADFTVGLDGSVGISSPLGIEAKNLTLSPSGEMYLVARNTTYPESFAVESVFWGLTSSGANITDFGDSSIRLGEVWASNTSPIALRNNEQGTLLLANNPIGGEQQEGAGIGVYALEILRLGGPGDSLAEQDINISSPGSPSVRSLNSFVDDLALGTLVDGPLSSIFAVSRNGTLVTPPFGGAATQLWSPTAPTGLNGGYSYAQVLDAGNGKVYVLAQDFGDVESDIPMSWFVSAYDRNALTDDWVEQTATADSKLVRDMALDSAGNLLVLDMEYGDEQGRIVRLNTDTFAFDTAWGNLGEADFTQPIFAMSALLVAPDGSIWTGGADANSRPVVVRLDADGTEIQRWTGPQLTRASLSRVVDLEIDNAGHINVLFDSLRSGEWRAEIVRIPRAH
ncbi:Ig-like domain-containing protein [Salinispirillum marinum]|uniref:Ig-like domain-containing protein n=2 Tax=Saccharospirillaceae TaxID=255527 RepID=A0ABV8BD90_9GAMM